MSLRDILLAVAVAALWGFAFVPIRLGVEEMPPLLMTGLRFLFSAVPAILFIRPPKAPVALVVAFGFVLGVVKFGLLFTAMKLGMPAGLSSLVMQMQVFFTILLAALVARETPTRLQLVAAAVALSGVAVIALSKGRGAPLVPFLMMLFASFVWGVANMLARMAREADMLAFIVWSSLVSPLPLFALSLAFDGPAAVAGALTHPSWLGAASVLFLAFGATLFCFSVWTRLLKTYPAAVVTPFALLVPVFGFFSGWLFLGEAMAPSAILGSALVLAGLAVNVFGPRLYRRG